MTEISLLGCGWLGLPLAQKLIATGYSVKGSTTSETKLATLQKFGINPYLVALSSDKTEGNLVAFLSSEILIIDIPPKNDAGAFSEKIRTLISHIEASAIKKVLLVSSISVYGDTAGIVDEQTPPIPDSANGKQLLEAEKLLQNANCEITILRFGGLIGPDRHPVKFLSGRINDHPRARINLIALEDCIGVICKIIALGKWGETYNAVSPFHPTRHEYYTKKAIEMKIPVPAFAAGGNEGKIVRADKIITDLDYIFEKPFL